MAGPAPMNAGSGVQTRIHSAFGAIDPALLDPGAVTVGSNVQVGFNARFASLEDADAAKFVLGSRYDQAEARPAASPFGERFSFDQSDAPGEPLQRSASFDDRFNHEPSGATPRANVQRVAAAPMPRPAPHAVAAQAAKQPQGRIQLASASATSFPLSYAPTDSVKNSATMGSALKEMTPKASKPRADGDRSRTAIYDITSQTVYLPNGRRLEAHSGFGDHMDDVRYVGQADDRADAAEHL